MPEILDANNRAELLNQLADKTFDLIVIGGGITGAGILREAALRGLRVAMLEAHDFASGTSGKSTKLIHGGLRYLAMGHIHVVRAAVRERKRVHRLAPHLAEPRWLMVPVTNRLGLLKYQAGISVYEHLGQVKGDDIHFSLKGDKLSALEPLLQTSQFPYACVYREYLTDDARLVLANIRAGVRAGGIAANKLPVSRILKASGTISGVTAACQLTGNEIHINARIVVNAAGPWVENICRLDNLPMPKSMLLSRGIHLVVPRHKLPVKEMVFTVARDRRPVFVIPRGEVTCIGTTDVQHPGGAELWPEVTDAEIDYLFEPLQRYFGVSLTAGDCLTSWAGLRPLIHEEGKASKEVSRKDEIWVSDSGLLTIAGGKLTGYRKMAEDTVAKACELMGIRRMPGDTDQALPGGNFHQSLNQLALDLTRIFPMADPTAARLVRLYGTEAEEVLRLGSEPVVTNSTVCKGEITWAMRQESAQSLEDVLYRRTRAALYQPEELAAILWPVAELMAEELGWDASARALQVEIAQGRIDFDSRAFRTTALYMAKGRQGSSFSKL